MIRKDFILQNYVGTGGKCDARAVRCHERIARWHIQCEHQLSHLPQFVTAQSQQNIQELGQAMKTLNQYYDDSLRRSRVEVPDENGKETRKGNVPYSGCSVNVVKGKDPVDYDGTPLSNQENASSANRCISSDCIQQPHHGTAEPEMRGLYILLTMDNDGGMEVLKYAARLFRERPEIYHAQPVQLALQVFKASISHLLPCRFSWSLLTSLRGT
jgi:SAC3/GANP family